MEKKLFSATARLATSGGLQEHSTAHVATHALRFMVSSKI